MIRALLKFVLVVVLITAAAAFFLGYRFAGDNDAPAAATAPAAAPAVDTERARQTGAEIGETVATGAAQARQAMSDGALTAKIKSKMTLDDTIRAAAIDVDTTGGAVTLSGTLRSEAERARALQLARETEGVISVSDRLIVR